MRAAGRLGLYGAGLVVVFAGAFGIAAAVVPPGVVDGWQKGSAMLGHDAHAGTSAASTTGPALEGLSLSGGGYLLSPVTAPGETGTSGELSFRVEDAAGRPLTDYSTSHGEDLHLIVVRSDGSRFRHVHPALDPVSGTWSIPWTWEAAGAYRIYADLVAAPDGASRTLSRTVEVAGDLAPASAPAVRRTAAVDGYTVTVEGDLAAGRTSELELAVTRDGKPVTDLQPYLGAFGHLVALRQGDLAYLHVHPEGEEPAAGESGGPAVRFKAEVPTAGRYLLYLDFRVAGRVRTAELVLDAAPTGAASAPAHDEHDGH